MGFRWIFSDPTIPESYTFECNPNADGSGQLKKNVFSASTTAPGGSLLLMEGRDTPEQITFTGTLLTETQYQAFVHWWAKRHAFMVTDDLGRQLWIYLTDFQPKRKWSHQHPWRHDYTLVGYVTSEAVPYP